MFTGEKNQFDWKLKLRKWSKRLHEDWCSWGKDILLNVKLKFKAYFFGSRSLALQIDFFLLDSHFMSLRYNNRTNEKAKENRILLFFFLFNFSSRLLWYETEIFRKMWYLENDLSNSKNIATESARQRQRRRWRQVCKLLNPFCRARICYTHFIGFSRFFGTFYSPP